jgi:hypothetical protein
VVSKFEYDVTLVSQQKVTPAPTNNTQVTNTQVTRKRLSPTDKSLVFKDANLRNGFTQISNVIIRDPRLTCNAKVLYILLLSYAWQDRECYPGQDTLAGNMGCNRRTVTRTLAELRKFKLVSWDRRGLGKSNTYYIERLSDGYAPVMYVDRGNSG